MPGYGILYMLLENKYMKILYWLPRILGIIIIIFWLVFILLSHGISAATLAEMVVIILLTAALLIAWKWPGWGAMAYFALSLFYVILTWQRFSFSTVMFVTGPLLLVGLLFIISKYKR